MRAQGHDHAEIVVPAALDRYGLLLDVIGAEGVESFRLSFPGGPIGAVAELASGFSLPLLCRCDRPDGG